MRSKFTLLMALAVMAFSISQCKKKTEEPVEEDPVVSPSGPNSVADIIAANGSPNNTFTLDASLGRTLTINGVVLDIPASAFTNTSSSVVSAGVVTVTVKTILTKSQVILSGAGANSSSSRLVTTKGCVKATASQNTQSLRLNNATNFYVCIPDPLVSPTPQKKYYAPKVTATDSTKFWALGNDVNDIPLTTYSSANYHKAQLDSLKWLNVGVQDNTPGTKVAVTVTVNPMFTKNNTLMYLSYDGSLTVGALFEIAPGVFRISNIPSGVATTIIAVAAIDGQYYAKAMPFTVPGTSSTVGLTMTAMSQQDMLNLVNTLQ
jgi:hypothetical protein